MVQSATGLKFTSAISLFFGAAMICVPRQLLASYGVSATLSSGDNEILGSIMFSSGLAWTVFASVNMLAQRVKNGKATSDLHFANFLAWMTIASRDLVKTDDYVTVMGADKTLMYINIALFAAVGLVNLKCWIDQGGRFPKFFATIGDQDASTWGIRLYALAWLYYGYQLRTNHVQLFSEYGWVASEEGAAAISLFAENWGIWAFLGGFLICCVRLNAQDGRQGIKYGLNRLIGFLAFADFFYTCAQVNFYSAMGRPTECFQINFLLSTVVFAINSYAVRKADEQD